ncbi:MAG: hypothetical protein AABZ29_07440 [Gemmatimonadota bacterium]
MATAGRTIRQGAIVGLIAFASVAVFYAAFDVLAARGTLYTVNLLGKAVFQGLRDPSVLQMPIAPDFTAIAWYSGLHLVLSLAIGLIVTGLVDRAEQDPSQGSLVLAVIVGGFVITIAVVGVISESIRPVLPWWSIVVANGAASACAGVYLLRVRPGIGRRLNPFVI